MKKLLTLMMNIGQIFSFLKNVLIFLIDRIYKEWGYMLGRGQSNHSEEAFERCDLFAKQLVENKFGKNDPYEMKGKRGISYGIASVVFGKAQLTGLDSLHQTNICSLTEEGNRLFINMTIGRGPLTYQRQIVFRLGNFVRKSDILISLTDIKVSGDFSVEKETGRNGFLLNLAVNKVNGFKLRVNGFGYLDWAINLFLSFWRLILGRIFRNLLEWELQQYILSKLPNHQFPVEEISYRNETKLKDERVQNNQASISESFNVKKSPEMPKWPMSSICESGAYDGHNSEEYGAEKDLGPNLDMNISRCFPETNKWISERNSFDLLLQRDPYSETLNEIYLNELSENETADRRNLVSKLSPKNRELTKTFEIMERKLNLINDITNSLSKDSALKNCLGILDEDKGNMNSASSSPAKGLQNEEPFVIRERKKGKSKLEDFSHKLRDSYREFEIASVENENLGQFESQEEIFSEIQEPSNKKDVDRNYFNMGIKIPARVTNCESSPSTKLESSQIHKNILEPSSTETGIFINITPDLDSERRKAQIDHLENMFNGKKRKERTKDSNKNLVSVESFNHCQSLEGNFSTRNPDLKLCSTKMFQNGSLISCTVSELEKQLKDLCNAFPGEVESQIEDGKSAKSYCTERNRSVESLEIQYISNPKDKVDGRNLLGSNVTSDSTQQKMIQDGKSFDSEVDTETVSPSLQFNEKHEHKVNEKIPFKYVKVYTEDELNEDSQLKADEGCSVADSLCEDSEDSSLSHPVFVPVPTVSIGYPAQSLDLRSKSLPNRSLEEPTKVEFGWKIDHFSVNSFNTSEISRSSKMRGKSDSINHITNDLSEEISLMEEIARWTKGDAECTDSETEISNIPGLKLNANSIKSSLKETSNQKTLHDLKEEIIVGTRKMLSDMALESDPEDDVYSSCKNPEYLKNKSVYNELNQFQRKDSKTDLGAVSLLEDSNTVSSVKEHSSLKYEDLSEFVYTSESDTETSSETENVKHEMGCSL